MQIFEKPEKQKSIQAVPNEEKLKLRETVTYETRMQEFEVLEELVRQEGEKM